VTIPYLGFHTIRAYFVGVFENIYLPHITYGSTIQQK